MISPIQLKRFGPDGRRSVSWSETGFIVLQSAYGIATSRHIHKRELKDRLLRVRDDGLSLREIASQVRLHETSVWQILK